MDNDALDIAVQAYIWGYPLVVMKRTKEQFTANRVAINTFEHASSLATAQSREVVAPNNDTLYSSAWLDLKAEPLLLHVPAMDRADQYYSLQFLDAYTNVFALIGRRTTGIKAGTYLISGPDWHNTSDVKQLLSQGID